MNAIEALTTRKSVAMLAEPGPDKAALETMIEAAVRAPDHCHLRPWRFLVIEGEARARLGDVFAEAERLRAPDTPDAMIEKVRGKPTRAPVIIAVIAKVDEHPKVPGVEQILSAGAAAQNIMLTAHALGFGGIWRTGKPCFDPHVKAALGAREQDLIVGFLYLGTPVRAPATAKDDIHDYMEHWAG
ncbi:MAG: nitroreductase [Alphaproteobacteria bacterium]|nr:MAG: nitroreductase [Alphaproteobacteria bacterium]